MSPGAAPGAESGLTALVFRGLSLCLKSNETGHRKGEKRLSIYIYKERERERIYIDIIPHRSPFVAPLRRTAYLAIP